MVGVLDILKSWKGSGGYMGLVKHIGYRECFVETQWNRKVPF